MRYLLLATGLLAGLAHAEAGFFLEAGASNYRFVQDRNGLNEPAGVTHVITAEHVTASSDNPVTPLLGLGVSVPLHPQFDLEIGGQYLRDDRHHTRTHRDFSDGTYSNEEQQDDLEVRQAYAALRFHAPVNGWLQAYVRPGYAWQEQKAHYNGVEISIDTSPGAITHFVMTPARLTDTSRTRGASLAAGFEAELAPSLRARLELRQDFLNQGLDARFMNLLLRYGF